MSCTCVLITLMDPANCGGISAESFPDFDGACEAADSRLRSNSETLVAIASARDSVVWKGRGWIPLNLREEIEYQLERHLEIDTRIAEEWAKAASDRQAERRRRAEAARACGGEKRQPICTDSIWDKYKAQNLAPELNGLRLDLVREAEEADRMAQARRLGANAIRLARPDSIWLDVTQVADAKPRQIPITPDLHKEMESLAESLLEENATLGRVANAKRIAARMILDILPKGEAAKEDRP